MAKLLLMLDPSDAKPAELEATLLGQLRPHCAGRSGAAVQLMRAADPDPLFNPKSKHPRPALVLELIVPPGELLSSKVDELLAPALEGLSLSASSLALMMYEHAFIPCGPQAFHHHFLMVKKPEFSDADYLDYYVHRHSRMGPKTPGIAGYSQNYIDPSGSKSIAALLGLQTRPVNSISELKLASVESFLTHPDLPATGAEAIADEKRFVDRRNSVAFTSEVVWRAEAAA